MDVPEIPSDAEALIQEKMAEFRTRNGADMQRRDGGSGSIGIDPGEDPIAREALVRLMEENAERVMVEHARQHPEQELEAEELQRMKQVMRDQVKAFFARHEKG